jgi:hypothetical protein
MAGQAATAAKRNSQRLPVTDATASHPHPAIRCAIQDERSEPMRIQFAIAAANTYARPSPGCAFATIGTRLRAWRARDRAELAAMDPRERPDLPCAREFDISNIVKPFGD